MKNKYTPLTFFKNIKECGFGIAFEIDASQTDNDAIFAHEYGKEIAKNVLENAKEELNFMDKHHIPRAISLPLYYLRGASAIVAGYSVGVIFGFLNPNKNLNNYKNGLEKELEKN